MPRQQDGRAAQGQSDVLTPPPGPVSQAEFASTIAGFVGESSGQDPALIHDDFDYLAEGLLDSFGIMSLFLFAEERFGVSFSAEAFDIREANTAARLYRHYVRAAAGRAAPTGSADEGSGLEE